MRPHLLSAALLCAALACVDTKEEAPRTRTYTFHSLAGMSMGAIGTGFLIGKDDNHERVDSVAMLGGPIDATYFLAGIERMQMGGFCPLERLEALANTEPEALNDPAALDCTVAAEPIGYEHRQSYNRWAYTNNGADFDRSQYLQIFYDLSLAFGNPLYHNEASGLFPSPEVTLAEFERADICTNPVTLQGFFNKEYNPEGKYPVITFCDGEEPVLYCDDEQKTPVDYCELREKGWSAQQFCQDRGGTKALQAGPASKDNPDLYFASKGAFDPCYEHRTPVSFALAVDLNGNGRRDFHEPVIANSRERFSDVGTDGCANEHEDGRGGCTAQGATGDPNGDDFDFVLNPLGTEGNFIHDEGEPFEDTGLDGVAGTGDFGEGNGRYDEGSTRQRMLDEDFRRRYLRLTDAQRLSLDVYADGGIRDVFNFGFSADMLMCGVRAKSPDGAGRFLSFTDIPRADGQPWEDGNYAAYQADIAALGRNVFVRYGDPDATTAQIRSGEGDHVGTYAQVMGRMLTYFRWLSERWTPALGEPQFEQGTGSWEAKWYQSEALGGPRDFSIALPPGYDLPENAERRYPVLFLLHGYGMEPVDMQPVNVVLHDMMATGLLHPFIVVYPSGKCCYVRDDGARDCRQHDDEGRSLLTHPDYRAECKRGSFFHDRIGIEPGDSARYGTHVFELMDHVDRHYRVLEPRTVELE